MLPQSTTRRLCSIPGCTAWASRRGWCKKHYVRWKRHGDPQFCCVGFGYDHEGEVGCVILPKRVMPEEERFWPKVNRMGPLPIERPELGPCWIWTGARTSAGYGQFSLSRASRLVGAHRWAYEHLVGSIAEGLQLDHLCRNPICVRPTHLEAVDAATNTLRGKAVSAANAKKTHCPQGHPYDLVNTRYRGRRRDRVCAICQRLRGNPPKA